MDRRFSRVGRSPRFRRSSPLVTAEPDIMYITDSLKEVRNELCYIADRLAERATIYVLHYYADYIDASGNENSFIGDARPMPRILADRFELSTEIFG